MIGPVGWLVLGWVALAIIGCWEQAHKDNKASKKEGDK
jgi:hypothetical protein